MPLTDQEQNIYGVKHFKQDVGLEGDVEVSGDVDVGGDFAVTGDAAITGAITHATGATAAVRAIDVGHLHLIPHNLRPAVPVLNGGTATSFTDVDFGAYVPAGVKALSLDGTVSWLGNGAKDYSFWELRQNGDTTTDEDKLDKVGIYLTNLGSGLYEQLRIFVTVLCDSAGVIEYRFRQGLAAVGELYLNINGYYL